MHTIIIAHLHLQTQLCVSPRCLIVAPTHFDATMVQASGPHWFAVAFIGKANTPAPELSDAEDGVESRLGDVWHAHNNL